VTVGSGGTGGRGGTTEPGSGPGGSATGGVGAAAVTGGEAGPGFVGASGVCVGLTGVGVGRCADGLPGPATTAAPPAAGTLVRDLAESVVALRLRGRWFASGVEATSSDTTIVRFRFA